MGGQHLNDLIARTHGMRAGNVEDSQLAWGQTAEALKKIEAALTNASDTILFGFGDGDTGPASAAAFTAAAAKIKVRREQMTAASDALGEAATAMFAAQQAAKDAPDAPPAEAPTAPTATGDPDVDIPQAKVYKAQKDAYDTHVTAYGDADTEARKKVDKLLARYAEAMTALEAIQPDDVPPPPGQHGGGDNPPGSSVPDVSTHHNRGGIRNELWGPNGSGPDIHRIGDDFDIDGNDVGDDGDLGNQNSVVDPFPGDGSATGSLPGSGGGHVGGGLSGGAVAGGAAAAGLFGAPGVIRGLRGIASARGLASGAGSIGATSRTAGAGSLGRSGAGTPGSQVNRAGGRGTAGRAGGRGKRRDKRDGADRDLYDDGQDWLDDEGSAPGVLD